MAINLLGMNPEGEHAWKFSAQAMNEGFEVTIGVFSDKIRYVAFKKKSPKKWEEADIRSCLNNIASYSQWSSKPGSDCFDYSEKLPTGENIDVTGWYTSKRKLLFVYVPCLTGDPTLTPDRGALDQKIP